MDMQIHDEYLSDDEIFFGKMTLKEVKKHLMIDRYRHSVPCTETKTEDSDCSLKIIEACSEPELVSGISLENSHSSFLSASDAKTTNSWDITTDNDSFLEMEKMVSNLLLVDNKEKEELDDTLDVVEYILNNAPHTEECHGVKSDIESSESKNCNKIKIQETPGPTALILSDVNNMDYCLNEEKTTVKERNILSNCELSPNVNESLKKTINKTPQNNLQSTPSCNGKQMNVFKTPKSTVPLKKQLQTPRSASKSKAYQHITSPVATYIKNGPQVPLLKEIRPKKPLSNVSLIPKALKSSEIKTNKENINLPSLAYKSAKNVVVIKIPDRERMPENQLAKSLSSSLHKPIVIKHNHREIDGAKKKTEPQQEDSFANLTLHQADVSVCTQKTAYNKLK